jgi:hypothetical protein
LSEIVGAQKIKLGLVSGFMAIGELGQILWFGGFLEDLRAETANRLEPRKQSDS